LALTALSLTPCHPPSVSVLSLRPCRLVFPRCRSGERKNKPTPAEGKKQMKFEEINNKTNEAFSFLVAALESGESEVLTLYLNAMARFHTYSFGNIMLIARQRAVTCCYTSLESMNMRLCALLETSDGA